GPDLVDRRAQNAGRLRVGCRQLGGMDGDAGDPLFQLADRERGRIHLVATERIEARHQSLHVELSANERGARWAPLTLVVPWAGGYLLAASTARRAMTFTRWARYSALAWM